MAYLPPAQPPAGANLNPVPSAVWGEIGIAIGGIALLTIISPLSARWGLILGVAVVLGILHEHGKGL